MELSPEIGAYKAQPSVTTRVCPGCLGRFQPARSNQLHCRPSCRALALERRRLRSVDLFTQVADAIEPEVVRRLTTE
jgi:hypothetical protein